MKWKKKGQRKIPDQRLGESKKERKFPIKKSEENKEIPNQREGERKKKEKSQPKNGRK